MLEGGLGHPGAFTKSNGYKRLPQNFFFSIAEYSCEGGIDPDDGAVRIYGNNSSLSFGNYFIEVLR